MGADPVLDAHGHSTVILFDGVCNLCQGSVKFVIKRDKAAYFKFASLQSDFGQAFLSKAKLQSVPFQSIILIQDNKHFVKSRAVLEIARRLSGAWPLLYGFIIVPSFIRDPIYSLIASNRYSWFGKQSECMIPTPDIKGRFIA